MKKLFYLAVIAISVFALNSCEKDEDTNNPSNDPTYEYYKPLIGEWSAYQYYGTATDEYGVEKSFDYSDMLTNKDITISFTFSEDMIMNQKYSDTEGGNINNKGNVVFDINTPNYFTVNYTNGKQFFEIVSVSSDKLHLKVDEGSSISNYVCKKK